MAQRASWRGHIRLWLVSFPVRLHDAVTSADKISLHQYHKDTGERIHYEKVTESGEEAGAEDIVRGYEYEKDHFVPIEDEDLEKLKLESKHTIDLVQFSDIHDVDPIYFEKSYYVVPDGEIAQEAYLMIREALGKTGKIAIGQIVLSNKERIVALRPCSNGLILDTLRYAYEVREAEDYFRDIPQRAHPSKEQVKLAEMLIEKKSAPFDPKAFKDHYQEGLMEIIKAKLGGKVQVAPREAKGKRRQEKTMDIVSALRQSLQQTELNNTPSTRKKAGAKRRPRGGG